jgi:hypothetical protein
MTASEECNHILQDIFQYDAEGMNQIVGDLCEEHGIAYDWETNGDEIDNLVIDNEDLLIHLYESSQNVEDETEEVENLTVNDEEFAF